MTVIYYTLQVCELVFEVQGKTANFIELVKDVDGVEFLGNVLK
jgi:hypothetical protein